MESLDVFNLMGNRSPFALPVEIVEFCLDTLGTYQGPKLVVNKGITNEKAILSHWNQ